MIPVIEPSLVSHDEKKNQTKYKLVPGAPLISSMRFKHVYDNKNVEILRGGSSYMYPCFMNYV